MQCLSQKQRERLMDLCRVWGVVKYFHPYLPAGAIDWDEQVKTAVRSVLNPSMSDTDYRACIAELVATLNDPESCILSDLNASHLSSTVHHIPSLKRMDDVCVITVGDPSAFIEFSSQEVLKRIMEEASNDSVVILDFRFKSPPSPESIFYYRACLLECLPYLTPISFKTLSSRSRIHSGFVSQAFQSSGDYHSGYLIKEGQLVHGNEKSRVDRLVCLVNSNNKCIYDIVGGLAQSGVAYVLHEGPINGDGADTFQFTLSNQMIVTVRTSEWISANGAVRGFRPTHFVNANAIVNAQTDQGIKTAIDLAKGVFDMCCSVDERDEPEPQCIMLEEPHSSITSEDRIISLYTIYHIIRYFFPYKHLMDQTEDELFSLFVDRFCLADDLLDYHLAVAELMSHFRDSHAGAHSSLLTEYIGTHYPPISIGEIEGQSVVININSDAQIPLSVGDVILEIDGNPVERRRELLEKCFGASTPQALNYVIRMHLLAGGKDSTVELTVQDSGGQIRSICVTRTLRSPVQPKSQPVYHVLDSGIGYIDLTRLTFSDITAALDCVKDTKGLIIDLRGYPHGTGWEIAARLASSKKMVAQFTCPLIRSPDPNFPAVTYYKAEVAPSGETRYKHPIAVLINEETISQAEHTCMMLSAANNIIFVGQPSNGADGDVTSALLAGGITITFTGQGVTFPDGRDLQRTGIIPDLHVSPTISGIRSGKDEILEAAISHLRQRQ
ncbi:MAG: hypothetical protein K6T83_11210 [Alicyclobacillus sp.]|nr:hypothetical protein [Alicyclobacillus sp.]